MRYVPRAATHPILGNHTQVRDLTKKCTVTVYVGLEAWERAEARCDELNRKASK